MARPELLALLGIIEEMIALTNDPISTGWLIPSGRSGSGAGSG